MSTSAPNRRGILLVNLGSPDSPSVPDVRRYLHQFLMDPRVIDTVYPLRKFIVTCTILPFRPKNSAEAYETIWWKEGSPLVVISRRVQKLLGEKIGEPIALGMRYGNPSIESALRELLGQNINEIFLAPLYPHYAMSSYETVVVEVKDKMRKLGCTLPLSILPPFYDNPLYIDALVESAREYLAKDYDHLLFSYHGLPERHLRKSDPTGSHCLVNPDTCCWTDSPAHATCYRAQVYRTTEAFVKKAGIPKEKYSVSFQSRLGRDPWVRPYTDIEIENFAKNGVKRMLVICPAFVSDCLETLEEIGIRARESFIAAGGEDLQQIPCMNDHPAWIEALAQLCAPKAPVAA